MPKISITTNDGELIEQIDVNEYNLDKPLAKSFLWDSISSAVMIAKRIESEVERNSI